MLQITFKNYFNKYIFLNKFFKKHFYEVKKIQRVQKIPKKLFYIKIYFSSCVIGTPVNFCGMTVRGRAFILK
jgi:hypothetical protein